MEAFSRSADPIAVAESEGMPPDRRAVDPRSIPAEPFVILVSPTTGAGPTLLLGRGCVPTLSRQNALSFARWADAVAFIHEQRRNLAGHNAYVVDWSNPVGGEPRHPVVVTEDDGDPD